MLSLNRHKKDITIAAEKRTPGTLLRFIFTGVLVLAATASVIGCKQGGGSPRQQSRAALDQLLSCTLQQAEDFDAVIDLASLETAGDAEIGLVQDDGKLKDYLNKRFNGSMTDACIEDLAMSRTIYRSAALARDFSSDIEADKIELTKRTSEQECYDFSAELKTSAGDSAAAASGTISLEKDGAGWKASHITLNVDEIHGQ